jgi:parvulin-like peptidyl-prolyl isomerase
MVLFPNSCALTHTPACPQNRCAEIIEMIKSGKITFNEAARQFSMDKAGRSGLLGWKRKAELDQDFWEAAVLIEEDGEFTPEPVKTQVR